MDESWWAKDWTKYLVGGLVGLPFGVLANWLYDKFRAIRRPRGGYFTASYSNGEIHFEGQYPTTLSVDEIRTQLLRSLEPTQDPDG